MFDAEILQALIPVMIAFAAGGVVYVLIYPFLTGEVKGSKRVKTVAKGRSISNSNVRNMVDSGNARRMQVQDTLKELEAKQKEKSTVTMRMRLERAGLNITPKTFYIFSVIFAVGVVATLFLTGSPVYIAAAAGAAAGLGMPRWILGFLAGRRQKKFVEEFANAIDIIVRGVKSGLPLNDCLKIIAAEAQEPVRTEFMELVEQIRIGIPVAQALEKMYQRIPIEEVNFFTIVIAIQQKAGGNLAEALSNLSGVLRDRKKLKGKIAAFSAEAKSSAGIIAALPAVVMLMVYMTTPKYIVILWTNETGQLMLAACGCWMFIGVLVMAKMINFDY